MSVLFYNICVLYRFMLNLNLPDATEQYAAVSGKYLDHLAAANKEGKKILGIDDILKKRVGVLDSEVEREWWGHGFLTNDGLVFRKEDENPNLDNNDRFKIVLNMQDICARYPMDEMQGSSVFIFPSDMYEKIAGTEIKRSDLHGRYLRGLDRVIEDQAWLILARHDPALLRAYKQAASKRSRDTMGLLQGFHPFIQSRQTLLAPWGITGVQTGSVLYTGDITEKSYVIVKEN